MGASKESFLKRKELADRLDSVVKSDWFKEAMAFACAEMMEAPNITTEHLAGVNKFRVILLSMTDEDSLESSPFPSSGLHHDLDIPERLPKPSEPSESPKRRKKRS